MSAYELEHKSYLEPLTVFPSLKKTIPKIGGLLASKGGLIQERVPLS